MDRRLFLAQLCNLTATAGVSGALGLTLLGCSDSQQRPALKSDDRIPTSLRQDLAQLVHAEFSSHAEQHEEVALYRRLLDKGVLSELGQYQPGRLEDIMRIEPMQEYQGFYYTETELELYTLAYLLR